MGSCLESLLILVRIEVEVSKVSSASLSTHFPLIEGFLANDGTHGKGEVEVLLGEFSVGKSEWDNEPWRK